MNVQITTESAADLPPGLARSLGIAAVPLQVLIDGKDYLNGVCSAFEPRRNARSPLDSRAEKE